MALAAQHLCTAAVSVSQFAVAYGAPSQSLTLVACRDSVDVNHFLWDLGEEVAEQREVADGDDTDADVDGGPLERACSCEGPACTCCVDFNFTYVDLGGPGCVEMTYLSPAEGINVNISYGDNVLLSEAIKGAKPDPVCLNMLGGLTQLCARFSDLAPTSDGLRWCLQLEPALLGDVQAQFPLGCFRMGSDGMVPDPPVNATLPPANTVETTDEDINEEALIAAVNESAEESISFLSNLLGITLSGSNKTQEQNTTEVATESSENPESKRRSLQQHKKTFIKSANEKL
ncbi:uncharacterized protein LOC126088403 [Schistocerca cancellata]|uniref:uncharacterized protein LOC126088403 n=1 Tax=Schistocerca cancellata TaxID=274614 RepID=UPI002117DCFC|nr:uncharacterized protein LOC126088403 [Schistocerca cancellata]